MLIYALGTDETDVCAFDPATGCSWVVCSTNIQADRPYEERVADAKWIVHLLREHGGSPSLSLLPLE